jgi:anti-anti-sigma factor
MLNVRHTKENGVIKLHLDGRLDSLTAPVFEQQLQELLKDGDYHVVMACDDLVFVSSAGLRVFLTFAKKIKKQSGNLALCGIQPAVYAILESSGLLSILKLCSNAEEAMAHVKPAQ